MVEPHRCYEEQQAECAQARRVAEEGAQVVNALGPGGAPAPGERPEPDPLGHLQPKHLPALTKIWNLFSEEDYYEIISAILEETTLGDGKTKEGPGREGDPTPPLSTILEDRSACPSPRGEGQSKGARRKRAPPEPGPLSKLIDLQEEKLRALLLDDEFDQQARESDPRGAEDPFLDVDLILNGEDGPEASPWSTGAPTEEPDGHEFQYFDQSPGELKEEEVKASSTSESGNPRWAQPTERPFWRL